MTGRLALVRRPGPRLDEGIVTHIERRRVDTRLAGEQWQHYVNVLRQSDWVVVEVPPADDCPDAVFVEDTVVMFGNVAVVTRPGADARKAEVFEVDKLVESLGLSVNRIVAPGTLDGGDVLKVGTAVYVGRGGRTNAEGIRQLRRIVAPLGYTVIAVPLTKVLHLKSAVTALPDGTIIGYPPLVDEPSVFDRFLPVPEESGAHVVVLDDTRVLMAADCPRSAALIADLGYEPITVDIGEFEKLEGCVTCLSVRVRAGVAS
ncbi:MAG TPA: N(G),N(G)-dimethylarginine dimethylaminohydrolase [Acidimicrobiales bacterium]|nr:N(G),N(G)-dimethylarginine dimethylaminohydrolase [Acidimicrobiales bacterium]